MGHDKIVSVKSKKQGRASADSANDAVPVDESVLALAQALN
jgi:hypothetical protein